ncbi:MAG: hypothetical protein OEV99_05280 [Nitrospira sp.]|nr:hypothetical protein [Nitrospira sp.]MDH4369238.1 hypothetical protein [Nitrospira sp.]MDH5348897.1 hypothetical protein [Nitrospira sp.]MDH5496688.1 hypothetical protein [Nitrospira sp.]MDH5724250.1 hypothetical protein [Nitrospira sp.]
MPDRRLIQLLGVIVLLNILHLVDHIFRGDFHWPIDEQSVGFMVVATVILGGMALGVWLYRAGRVGPRFWTMVGTLGLGLGWLSHFSSMTDQPLTVIYQGYTAPWAGALAVGCLFLLMLSVFGATVYAGYLWTRIKSRDE